MAPRRTERLRIEELLKKFDAEIRAAFLAAVDDLRAGVDLQALIRALEAGDVRAAIDACHVEGAAYHQLRRAFEAAYIEAGVDAVRALPTVTDWRGAVVGVRFDPSYPRAADWTAQHGAGLVQVFADDQRGAIRDVVEGSLRTGTNPRAAAIQIAGPVNRATGKREGGILGLTRQQTGFVQNAREELSSGNPDQLTHYLTRQARDRGYDGLVKKAIASGKPLDVATINRMTGRYSDMLLKYRADVVARTESTQATSAARQEAMRQTLEAAGMTEADVERTWRATRDNRTRETHREMDGQKVQGLETAFTSPSGATLRYPGDPNAPASETIQCRCFVAMRLIRPQVVEPTDRPKAVASERELTAAV